LTLDLGHHEQQTLRPDIVPCGFINQRVYCDKPVSLEDLKHNTKYAAVGTALITLRKFEKKT
jgi:hypothetical protein